MRDIKFRAWIIKEKRMVFVDTISHNKGYGGALEIIIDNPSFDPCKKNWEGDNRPCDSYLNHSMEVHKERNNGDDFVLMQYTGLKDKNDKEIYECDIVKWGHTHKTGMGHEDPIRIARVEINPDLQFHILNYKMDFLGQNKVFRFGNFIYTDTKKYLEVIGNIYENPKIN